MQSPEHIFHDPSYSTRRRKADLSTVRAYVSGALGVDVQAVLGGKVPLETLSRPAATETAAPARSETIQSHLECPICHTV